MQNEILKPVLATDETAIPRYDIVNPDGSVMQQNVELRLKNQVMQEGTPYDEESVLPAELATQLGLPTTATPAQAFQRLSTLAKSNTIGDMKDTVRTNLGDSWLLCNGDTVNRDEYPELYDILEQAGVTGYVNLDLFVYPAYTHVSMGVANGIPWFTGCSKNPSNQYEIKVKLIYFDPTDSAFHEVMLTAVESTSVRSFDSQLKAELRYTNGEYMIATVTSQAINSNGMYSHNCNAVATWWTRDIGSTWSNEVVITPNSNTYAYLYFCDLIVAGSYFVLTTYMPATSTGTTYSIRVKKTGATNWIECVIQSGVAYGSSQNQIKNVYYLDGYLGIHNLVKPNDSNGNPSNYWFYANIDAGITTFKKVYYNNGGNNVEDLGQYYQSDIFMRITKDGKLEIAGKPFIYSSNGIAFRFGQVNNLYFNANSSGQISRFPIMFNQNQLLPDNTRFPIEVNGFYVYLWQYYNNSPNYTSAVTTLSFKDKSTTVTTFTNTDKYFFPYNRCFWNTCIYENGKYYIFGIDGNYALLAKYGTDLSAINSTLTIANDVGLSGNNNVEKLGDYYYIVTCNAQTDKRVKVHYAKTVGGAWTTDILPDTDAYTLEGSTLLTDGTNVIVRLTKTISNVKYRKTFYRPLNGSAGWTCIEDIAVQQAFERGGCYYCILDGETYQNYVCKALGQTPSRLNDSAKPLKFNDLSAAFAYQADSAVPQLSAAVSITGYAKLPSVAHNDHYTYIKAKEET